MQKFKKGHSYGFKPNFLPHNKAAFKQALWAIPCAYKILSPEMTELVNNPPSASERKKQSSDWGHHYLLGCGHLRVKQNILQTDITKKINLCPTFAKLRPFINNYI